MSLKTMPRYDVDGVSAVGERAVVVGGSVAGLVAARVLADGFERVVVLERDALPDEPAARRGVPQSSHPHALMEAGRATLEDLFPGFGEDVVANGGLLIDAARDFDFFGAGGYLAEGPTPLPMYCSSRPLLEHVLAQRVSAIAGVDVRAGHGFVEYLADEDRAAVTGVLARDPDGTDRELAADLVVDATGRSSRTPAWLEDHGYPSPALDEIRVDLAYATTTVERPRDDRRGIWAPAAPPHTRGGGAVPIEGGRWQVLLHGVHGDDPPTDPAGFSAFAGSLPIDEVSRLLDTHAWAEDDVHYYPFPSTRRYYYEDLDRFPEGLVAVGDAVASFNPVYGQGMSVAALDAVALHHALAAGGTDDLARRYFDRVAPVIDDAWLLAAGADFQFEETTGPRPRGVGLMNRYLSRLLRRAHSDGVLADAFARVFQMEDPPGALLRPSVAWRVFAPERLVNRSSAPGIP